MPLVEVAIGPNTYASLEVPDECTVGLWKQLLGEGFLGDKILYSVKLACHEHGQDRKLEDGALLPLAPFKMQVRGPGSVVKMLELALKKKLGPPVVPRAQWAGPARPAAATPTATRPALVRALTTTALEAAALPVTGAQGVRGSTGDAQQQPEKKPQYQQQQQQQEQQQQQQQRQLEEEQQDLQLRYLCSGLQGMRQYMEDRTCGFLRLPGCEHCSLFAVFDGHGGHEVAELSARLFPRMLAGALTEPGARPEDALRETFWQLDEELRRAPQHERNRAFERTGSTAVVVLLLREAGQTRIICANVGDSRAVLCRGGQAFDLSVDQKPQNPLERRRIEAAGGRVELYGPCWRIDAGLNLSRALADFAYKSNSFKAWDEQKVICEPEIEEVILGKEDTFIVMGSDGVFDVFSSQALVGHLLEARRKNWSAEEAVETALQQALEGGDNCSICLVEFLERGGPVAMRRVLAEAQSERSARPR